VRRSTSCIALILLATVVGVSASTAGPESPAAIESYFSGKEVVLKIDMPGTNKGIDLRFSKPSPMDWKEYSSRLEQFGPALRKGDTARVTTIVVKKDMIEFQLDGGGFGTFRDDTNTKVDSTPVEKNAYEKNLEKQIADSTDDDQKRSLQNDLDRERARRERQQAANDRAAQIASQIKAQQVSDNRMRGGSRFNLRWQNSIPANQLNPAAVTKLLADYVDFTNSSNEQTAVPADSNQNGPTSSGSPPSTEPDGSATAQLKRGMKLSEVTDLLGQGKQLSESTSNDGLKTEVYEYAAGDRSAEVTYVDGIVVRFSISSK
jgi:hypothetical protein